MEALIYRPLFLRLGWLLRDSAFRKSPAAAPLAGECEFSSSEPDALDSLVALFLWLSGGASLPSLTDGRVSGGSASELSLRLEPATAPYWAGRGEVRRGGFAYRFSLGLQDRLSARAPDGSESRIVLPEGDAAYYAELDRRECAASGRDSRILDSGARRRVRALLDGGRG